MVLSCDLRRIQESYCKCIEVVSWSDPCAGVEGSLNNWIYARRAKVISSLIIATPRRMTSIANIDGTTDDPHMMATEEHTKFRMDIEGRQHAKSLRKMI